MRLIDQNEIDAFLEAVAVAEKDPNNKDEQLKEAYEILETNIQLLGATVVEDKL